MELLVLGGLVLVALLSSNPKMTPEQAEELRVKNFGEKYRSSDTTKLRVAGEVIKLLIK